MVTEDDLVVQIQIWPKEWMTLLEVIGHSEIEEEEDLEPKKLLFP